MNNLEYLLRRHAEGSLTPEEKTQLDMFTHHDDVMKAANQRAGQIRRQRGLGISAAASVLIVAGFFFLHNGTSETLSGSPVTAEAEIPTATAVQSEKAPVQPLPAAAETAYSKTSIIRHDTTSKLRQARDTEPIQAVEPSTTNLSEEIASDVHLAPSPIVACNTECSPEDVIDDIWKFLNA